MSSELEDRFYSQLRDAEREKPILEDGPPKPPVQEKGEPEYAPFTARNFLAHHDTHPLLLDSVLLDIYGVDWLEWEPETVRSELQDDLQQPSISALNWQQIRAVRLCHLSASPWKAWEVFALVCQAFNNNIPDFQTLQPPTIAQVMVALDLMGKFDNHEFSEEVAQFVAAAFLDQGVFYAPPPAGFCQMWIASPKYRCQECGKIDRDDENDVCDSCGAPESSLAKEYERDFRPIKARYEVIVAQGEDHDELQETVEDVQVAKLLVARDYVQHRKRQLLEQLKVVRDAKQVRSGSNTS